MEPTGSSPLDAELEFPTIPQEKIPEDRLALRRMLAGERGMDRLYSRLETLLEGESHCLAVLLRRDWERHFRDLQRHGESLLASLGDAGLGDSGSSDPAAGGPRPGGGASAVGSPEDGAPEDGAPEDDAPEDGAPEDGAPGNGREILPRREQIDRLAESLRGSPPLKVLELVGSFASRALICHQMVPWVSDLSEVFEHFKACVEAEDHHLALQQLFSELLAPVQLA